MAAKDPRQLAIQQLSKSNAVLHTLAKDPFLSYEDEAYVATHAQAYATRAVAYALLDLADAVRATSGESS